VKPLRLRPQAEIDLVAQVAWLGDQAGSTVAARFFDTARAALATVQRNPGIGSTRLGQIAGIAGLRAWGIDGFHARWLHLDLPDAIDVVRLLGDRQDIATILRDEPV
jgi:toxin ParE1/3/4